MRQNWLKKVIGVGLSAVLCMSALTGCGGGGADASSGNGEDSTQAPAEQESQAAQGGELTIGVTSFADTLEPTEQYFSWVVSRYGVGECLVRFDESGEMVPCLAENSAEGLTWTFTIRQGVQFSNGNYMTP